MSGQQFYVTTNSATGAVTFGSGGVPPEDAEILTETAWLARQASMVSEHPAFIPTVISDRQFAEQAAVQGLITETEALAWVGPGTIPETLLSLVDQLPEDFRFPAKMMLTGATTFDRTHGLTIQLTELFGWTDAQRDAFWTAAAAL